jgi:hypothetical protein
VAVGAGVAVAVGAGVAVAVAVGATVAVGVGVFTDDFFVDFPLLPQPTNSATILAVAINVNKSFFILEPLYYFTVVE